ncbi:hypothetical protein [Hymenobacter mucosus]|uniref:hypothetical protein n=1 Tax=Hymenobacter mucosus TaxID=1411120 RepID=UPI00117A57D1|nr:hypothetical protein [Hymenobacter mucosus]
MKRLLVAVFALGTILSGCDDDDNPNSNTNTGMYITEVSVSENGAPPYVLPQAQIGSATYQGSTANLTISGKLTSGDQVRLTFSQSSPTAAGANVTDVVEVYSDKLGDAKTASGRTTRNASLRTVSGSFTSTFAGGATLSGTLTNVPVQ